jgi:hypothetical protein
MDMETHSTDYVYIESQMVFFFMTSLPLTWFLDWDRFSIFILFSRFGH